MRCRAPCLLGFSSCLEHSGKLENPTETISYSPVTRIFDYDNKHYFVDSYGIARDRNGRAKGVISVEDEVEQLRLFEVWKKPPTAKEKEEEA